MSRRSDWHRRAEIRRQLASFTLEEGRELPDELRSKLEELVKLIWCCASDMWQVRGAGSAGGDVLYICANAVGHLIGHSKPDQQKQLHQLILTAVRQERNRVNRETARRAAQKTEP
jgi:hypothetical protein